MSRGGVVSSSLVFYLAEDPVLSSDLKKLAIKQLDRAVV